MFLLYCCRHYGGWMIVSLAVVFLYLNFVADRSWMSVKQNGVGTSDHEALKVSPLSALLKGQWPFLLKFKFFDSEF